MTSPSEVPPQRPLRVEAEVEVAVDLGDLLAPVRGEVVVEVVLPGGVQPSGVHNVHEAGVALVGQPQSVLAIRHQGGRGRDRTRVLGEHELVEVDAVDVRAELVVPRLDAVGLRRVAENIAGVLEPELRAPVCGSTWT